MFFIVNFFVCNLIYTVIQEHGLITYRIVVPEFTIRVVLCYNPTGLMYWSSLCHTDEII